MLREILNEVLPWYRRGEPFVIATVVRTWSSSPRQPGAAMAVSATGEVVGSVSGGCVEGAVYDVAQGVMSTGLPELVRYGVSDDDAFSVGLTCGGTLELFVQRIDHELFPHLEALALAVERRESTALVTVLTGTRMGQRMLLSPAGVLGALGEGLDDPVVSQCQQMLREAMTGTVSLEVACLPHAVDVFVESFSSPPLMLVFGAIDFSAAAVQIGKFLGYYVIVCDARATFATEKRFPWADEVVVAWPHQFLATVKVTPRTVICVLTHDPKFDVPLLQAALATNAGYIGALGSRRTHELRLERLRAEGISEGSLTRLRSPIGLHLGARTPEETAVAIAAEIVAATYGGSGVPLSRTVEAIHVTAANAGSAAAEGSHLVPEAQCELSAGDLLG